MLHVLKPLLNNTAIIGVSLNFVYDILLLTDSNSMILPRRISDCARVLYMINIYNNKDGWQLWLISKILQGTSLNCSSLFTFLFVRKSVSIRFFVFKILFYASFVPNEACLSRTHALRMRDASKLTMSYLQRCCSFLAVLSSNVLSHSSRA